MSTLTKGTILYSLTKHETLSIDDLSKEIKLGMVLNTHHLNALLTDLKSTGHIDILNDIEPVTYTITEKGIQEGLRLSHAAVINENV